MCASGLTRAIASLVLLGSGVRQDTSSPTFTPTAQYETRSVQGFRVLVDPGLIADKAALEPAMAELDHQLYLVNRRLPAKALEKLHGVRIWLERDDRGVLAGVYHPSADWLREHGYNPDKARCVEIGNARNLVAWSLDQPYMLLHELAHAYHHQVLGYGYAPVAAAYREAVDSKRYETVLHVSGQTRRHYALSNDQEFFAEMSECYFGTNDFYPFVRGELKSFDPPTYKVVAEAWGLTP